MSKDDAKIIQLWESATQEQPTKHATNNGGIAWKLKDGTLHREDGPAVEWSNGSKKWFYQGQLHRIDGPAEEYANGAKTWWQWGKRHRTSGPAIELDNGEKYWYINDYHYADVYAWAEAALKWVGIESPTDEQVNDKVQQTLAKNILD